MLRNHNSLFYNMFICIIIFSSRLCVGNNLGQEGYENKAIGGIVTTQYQFKGVASGGILTIAETFNRNARFISIETQAGESAESVAKRFADTINRFDPFEWGITLDNTPVSSSAAVLKGLLGNKTSYMFTGSEIGLGIPEPPTSVSCSYDQDKNQIIVNWLNMRSGYDYIAILMNWHNYDRAGGGRVSGQLTNFTIARNSYQQPIDLNDLDVWVIGVKDGLPSNAGAVHIGNNGKTQEERYGIPFKNDVVPNWQKWSYGAVSNGKHILSCTDEILTVVKGKSYNSIKTADSKPFKQVLKTLGNDGSLGIWRKFLGLVPGHTYRITARLNTLTMDPNNPNWSFSLHAVPDDPKGTIPTAQQFAGLESMPNGSKGFDVGKVVKYEGKATTKNKFEESSADITLPENVTSITVWLRLTGKDTGEVSFDWIKLEDITPEK